MPSPVTSFEMNSAAPLTTSLADTACGLTTVAQTAHGLAIGDVVRESSVDTFAKAQADTEANINLGVTLVIAATGANKFTALRGTTCRDVTISAHGFGAFGAKLWLSQGTAGLITATEPPTGLRWYLGYVLDANTIHWQPWADWQEV